MKMVEVVHYSVMKNEVVSFLKPDKPGQIFVDATTGEGGHSEWLLKHYPDLNLVCLDADSGFTTSGAMFFSETILKICPARTVYFLISEFPLFTMKRLKEGFPSEGMSLST